MFRKKPRQQNVESPIDASEWVDWSCSKKEGQLVEKAFSKMPAAQCKRLGILAIAEKIAELDNAMQDKLREKYKACTGKKAKDRRARVDLIVGIVAHYLEDEE